MEEKEIKLLSELADKIMVMSNSFSELAIAIKNLADEKKENE